MTDGLLTRSVVSFAGAAIVLVLAVFAYRSWPAPWDWLRGGTNGQIIINSPTVYTRQRLVNDRLSQATWLQEQLKATDSGFRSVDQLYRGGEQRQTRAGLQMSPPAADGSVNPEPKKPDTDVKKPDQTATEPVTVATTTPAEFRAKNLYREEVRAEITQTQLDDRHDISGNTIYRLAFDATVVAGTRRDAVAGVKITISHRPHETVNEKNKKNKQNKQDSKAGVDDDPVSTLYREDYDRLYSDWLRFMQVQVTTSIDNIFKGIVSGDFDAKTRLLLTRFLLNSVCELKLELETPRRRASGDPKSAEDDESECDAQVIDPKKNTEERRSKIAKNRREAFKFFNEEVDKYSKKREDKSKADFELQLKQYLVWDANYKAAADEQKTAMLDGYYQHARLYCLQGSQIYVFVKDYIPSIVNKALKIDCPYRDTPAQRLKIGVLIYEKLVGVKRERDGDDPVVLAKELVKQKTCETERKDLEFCAYTDLQASSRCFAADFINDNLNSRTKRKWHSKLSYFLNLDIIGRDVGDCNLLVSATTNYDATVDELKYMLNEGTEAFAYSVSPKNLTENISTALETRDSYEFLARYGAPGDKSTTAFVNDLLQRSSETRAVLAHPIVVGFSSGRKKPQIVEHPKDEKRWTALVREIEMGWIVAPRKRGRDLEQIDNQYALTTVISVPSWWRSVELDIETCWVPRERLSAVQLDADGTLSLCKGLETQPKKAVVRLPGAIGELSRKLGFDVLQEPYLSDNPIQVLEIGQPGSLLLKGARLWRSTEVTIGSQKAHNIVVLPNMDGILAQFQCVLPQLRNGGYDGEPIATNAYVWTSEGVTTGAPVLLIWPDWRAPRGESAATGVAADASPGGGNPGGASAGSGSANPPASAAGTSAGSAVNPTAPVQPGAGSGGTPAPTVGAAPITPGAGSSSPPANSATAATSTTARLAANTPPGPGTKIDAHEKARWCPELWPKQPAQ